MRYLINVSIVTLFAIILGRARFMGDGEGWDNSIKWIIVLVPISIYGTYKRFNIDNKRTIEKRFNLREDFEKNIENDDY